VSSVFWTKFVFKDFIFVKGLFFLSLHSVFRNLQIGYDVEKQLLLKQ